MPAKRSNRGNMLNALLSIALTFAGVVPSAAWGALLTVSSIRTAYANQPLTQIAVTTTSDTADGTTSSFAALAGAPGSDGRISLREALMAANREPPGPQLTITFAIPTDAPGYQSSTNSWWITLADDTLPPLGRGRVTIDGATQPGSGDRPSVYIDGADVSFVNPSYGLLITSPDNTVRRLGVVNFWDVGVVVEGSAATGNTIAGSAVGVGPDGEPAPNGNGIEIRGGASNNTIGGSTAPERNIIAGNVVDGLVISGATTRRNVVEGNYFGADFSGLRPAGSHIANIVVDGALETAIGGAGRGNVILGATYGIDIRNRARRTLVAGNIVGLGQDGRTRRTNEANPQTTLGNHEIGIYIRSGASDNRIGGVTPGERNVIANTRDGRPPGRYQGHGILIISSGTVSNTIQGNFIGTDISGYAPQRGNAGRGIMIEEGADRNVIGGEEPGAGNVIVYNGFGGLEVRSATNQIAGNLIGVGVDKTTPLSNQYWGVSVAGDGNTLYGDNIVANSTNEGVVIRGRNNAVQSSQIIGNDGAGLCINGANTLVTGNLIKGNGGGTLPGDVCPIQGGIVISSSLKVSITANLIHNNIHVGIRVTRGRANMISLNSISGSRLEGIVLEEGGNDDLEAPSIISATQQAVKGRACDGCRVEVFADTGDEGLEYLGTTRALADGSFTLAIGVSVAQERNVTATNIDNIGNTSPFAQAVPISADPDDPPGPPPPQQPLNEQRVFLPLIRQ